MTSFSDPPAVYVVTYSEQVRSRLRELLRRADANGVGQEVRDAVLEFDRRLKVYPQFGEPQRDLRMEGETLWTGTVGPLVLRYIIDEPRRTVFVVEPFKTFSRLGL